jgi:fumarate reductase subunit C
MSKPKPYVRPMSGWWLKNPRYVQYMVREATSIFVGMYALILLVGVARLGTGEAAYAGWLGALQNPVYVAFHLVALAAALLHTVTWFSVAPKVVPTFFIGESRVSDGAITLAQYVIAAVVYGVILILVLGR